MPSDQDARCRVCGLLQAEPPWGEDGQTPTFAICDCCGVEFGYEDSTSTSVKRYRSQWIEKGAPWFQPNARPLTWDLEEQLKQVPEQLR